jgi:hypothetical protein
VHVHVVQANAVGSEACQSVSHSVGGCFVVKIGIEAGVGSPKSDSPFIGGEMPIGNANESMFAGRCIEMMRNVRDIVGSVKGNDKGKQLAGGRFGDTNQNNEYDKREEMFHGRSAKEERIT